MEKYSDKFLNQNNKLKDAIIGFEFEFYLKDLSYYKTLEKLNQELNPVKVWGFRQYHSEFTPDDTNFKLEPDLSGGNEMVELITGPLPYMEAKYHLVKIIKFIQTHGYTNDKCSIHFNISFNDEDMNLNNLNILKLLLNIDEEEIYRVYPHRQNNMYAKSVKTIIPFKEYDFFNMSISVVRNNLRIPSDKYYGINLSHIDNDKDTQRIEFRYIGGEDFHKNIGQIIYFMERFIILTHDCINSSFTTEDINKLEQYLEENISKYKNLSLYDNFISEYPSIHIQIDQNSNYEVVSSYYNKIYDKLYNILNTSTDLNECIINYVTKTQSIEIIDADVKIPLMIKSVDFINCNIQGIFEDCIFVNSEINNSHLTKCDINESNVMKSKVLDCHVNDSDLKECFFNGGYLNGNMFGGIFRSGKLGPYTILDSDVKIITDHTGFFNTKYNDENDKGSYKKNFFSKNTKL